MGQQRFGSPGQQCSLMRQHFRPQQVFPFGQQKVSTSVLQQVSDLQQLFWPHGSVRLHGLQKKLWRSFLQGWDGWQQRPSNPQRSQADVPASLPACLQMSMHWPGRAPHCSQT
jgi:hypothetical protein